MYSNHCIYGFPYIDGGKMKFKPFLPGAIDISDEDAKLAAELRRIACEVERGAVRQLVITLIRPDGTIERLGNSHSTAKAH